MTRRFPYDRTRAPAAPALPVTLGRPGTVEKSALLAVVDTGTELTVIPDRVARSLRLPVTGEVTVQGLTGSRRVRIHGAELEINGVKLTIDAAAVGTHALIGRDVINQWTLILRGPTGILELDAEGGKPASSGDG